MRPTAVIIPFFQRKQGVLAAAVRSALAQRDAGPVTVVVCDDGSPVPADAELAMLDAAERERVALVRQANAGAAAARNAALDAVPPGTEWIAFLDSGDCWGEQHLSRAVAALSEGFDLCFADAIRDTRERTHFQAAGFVPGQHEPVGTIPGLHRFTGDFLTLHLKTSPVSISTVVMRAATLGDLRFRAMEVETLMYRFDAARQPIRVAFDGTLQVRCGHGDITFGESWASPKTLSSHLIHHRVFARVLREFALLPEQRAMLDERMADNRYDFATAVLALLHGGAVPAWDVVADFAALDPWVLGTFVRAAATETARRLPSRWVSAR